MHTAGRGEGGEIRHIKNFGQIYPRGLLAFRCMRGYKSTGAKPVVAVSSQYPDIRYFARTVLCLTPRVLFISQLTDKIMETPGGCCSTSWHRVA